MSNTDNLGQQITSPTLELAARIKALLETDPEHGRVETTYGNFYVAEVKLKYYYGGESETLGYLVPDEHEGNTYDFYTPKDYTK